MKPLEHTGPTTMGTFGLAATIELLRNQGYYKDFNLDPDKLDDEYVIDHVYRFDVWTDPADQAVLYALRSRTTGEKGIFINSYGLYSESKKDSQMNEVERWEDSRHNQV
jgi:hypothetical protein